MNRLMRLGSLSLVVLGLALAGCGGDEHAGHDHGPGEKHEEPK